MKRRTRLRGAALVCGGVLGLSLVGTAATAVADTESGGTSPRGSTENERTAAPTRATVDTTASHLARELGIDIDEATRQVQSQTRQSALATPLLDELGGRTGGAYFDPSGDLVVTVTDAAAADQVRAAGLTPRTVGRSLDTLRGVVTELDTEPVVVGATVAVDVDSNQVVVSLPADAVARQDPQAVGLRAAAERQGSAVRVEETDDPAQITRDVAGGDPMRAYANVNAYCSAGFNVRYGSGAYVLLAGHCFQPGFDTWINWDGYYLGHRHAASFPGVDYGLIRITDPVSQIPGVYTYNGQFQWINHAADMIQNQYVCKSGATTGVTCGTVLFNDATAYYWEGAVYDLDAAQIYAAGGDSGGSVFAGTAALGLVSGGNVSTSNPLLFVQPVRPAMAAYQVSLS